MVFEKGRKYKGRNGCEYEVLKVRDTGFERILIVRWHSMERTNRGDVYSMYNTEIAVIEDIHTATVYLDDGYDTMTDGVDASE